MFKWKDCHKGNILKDVFSHLNGIETILYCRNNADGILAVKIPSVKNLLDRKEMI